MAERTITITGIGKVSVKPDTVRLLITQSETLKNYKKAVEESAKKKTILNGILEELGFSKEEIKTLSFDIDTVNNGNWKNRNIVYKYTHRMKLEFPRDSELLGRTLYSLAHCPGRPEFDVCFTVSDPEKVKTELIGKAMEDARAKAETLTKAGGASLGAIQTIDYSWGEISLVTRSIGNRYCGSMDSNVLYDLEDEDYCVDIEPDVICASETVTAIWEIQ